MCEVCRAVCETWETQIVPNWNIVRATTNGDIMRAGQFALTNLEYTDLVIFEEITHIMPNDFFDNLKLRPERGFDLVKSAIESGWDPSGDKESLPLFLWNRIKEIVANEQPAFNSAAENEKRYE